MKNSTVDQGRPTPVEVQEGPVILLRVREAQAQHLMMAYLRLASG